MTETSRPSIRAVPFRVMVKDQADVLESSYLPPGWDIDKLHEMQQGLLDDESMRMLHYALGLRTLAKLLEDCEKLWATVETAKRWGKESDELLCRLAAGYVPDMPRPEPDVAGDTDADRIQRAWSAALGLDGPQPIDALIVETRALGIAAASASRQGEE